MSRTHCAQCNQPLGRHVSDNVDYCSEECWAHAEGRIKCPCCWTLQPGETFQPARRPHPGIRATIEALLCLPPPRCVCEECAETCVACGERGDVERLDPEGRCSACTVRAPLVTPWDAYEAQAQGLDPYERQL